MQSQTNVLLAALVGLLTGLVLANGWPPGGYPVSGPPRAPAQHVPMPLKNPFATLPHEPMRLKNPFPMPHRPMPLKDPFADMRVNPFEREQPPLPDERPPSQIIDPFAEPSPQP